ncbi:MAG TPA: nitrogenase stabilizing/protective protein NifW [Rhodopseudomonas sp.]|uniref:nitrogenase stabilizing/protective protein NifW n=1 Tax=Rhodopseudomonas sp. TaxID=1078 RepID=UPI002EDB1B1E
MCSPTQSNPPAGNVVDQLKRAGSAEEFFALLGVCFDPKVLDVARLHILKRMGQYLASEDLEAMPNSVAAARCKSVLERAYEDFLSSTPLDQRVFKVLKDAVAPKKSHFVPLDALK